MMLASALLGRPVLTPLVLTWAGRPLFKALSASGGDIFDVVFAAALCFMLVVAAGDSLPRRSGLRQCLVGGPVARWVGRRYRAALRPCGQRPI